ncbi:MAG TPA: hypothetical protein VGJ21_18020 [Terracidiphilus sp.]
MNEILSLLSERTVGDAYSSDGTFAVNLSSLAPGLRAMAATHWLDISLTLDSITWHFGNFGEPGLVALTEAGLTELGMDDLAQCFREARDLMVPLLENRTAEGGDPYEILEREGLEERGDELDKRAWDVNVPGHSSSAIYNAWIRYARAYPENVFAS